MEDQKKVDKFWREYVALCKKYGMEINFTPSFEFMNGKFQLTFQYTVGKLSDKK